MEKNGFNYQVFWKFLILLLLLEASYTFISYGQNEGLVPPSYRFGFDINECDPQYVKSDISGALISKENNGKNGLPMQAGFSIKTQFSIYDDAIEVDWGNGEVSRFIRIISPGAPALGVVIDVIDLSSDAVVYVYTPLKENFASLTHQDIISGVLSSTIFAGEEIIVEYTEKRSNATKSLELQDDFMISELVVITNGFEAILGGKGLGDSGSCQVNINCTPEGNNWTRQKRGVARILFRVGANWYWCSGSLVNTTAQDGTPYFLTAQHCGGNASIDDREVWKFYFNYERPFCPNNGTPPENLITGCTLKAMGPLAGGSDFQLVQLSSAPPTDWNPYYNGWDRSTANPTAGVGIHHPSGDAKKISTYFLELTSATPNIDGSVMASNAAWQVNWIQTTNGHGVTEGGSSGSPVFNSAGLIVGTLSGGSSTCTNPVSPDFYGKFSYHWESNGTSNMSKLQPWLDPQGLNPTSMQGYDIAVGVPIIHKTNVNIYPNPFTNSIHIEAEHPVDRIDVYNLLGQLLLSSPVNSSKKHELNLENLPNGIYMINLKLPDGEVFITKIIKQ